MKFKRAIVTACSGCDQAIGDVIREPGKCSLTGSIIVDPSLFLSDCPLEDVIIKTNFPEEKPCCTHDNLKCVYHHSSLCYLCLRSPNIDKRFPERHKDRFTTKQQQEEFIKDLEDRKEKLQ